MFLSHECFTLSLPLSLKAMKRSPLVRTKKEEEEEFQRERFSRGKTRKLQRETELNSIGLFTVTLEARRHQKNAFIILRKIISNLEFYTYHQ